jgi:hypothetical protein
MLGIAIMAGTLRAADDAGAIADRYVAAMERKGYSFVTKEELSRRHEVVAADVTKWLHAPLADTQRTAVLEGAGSLYDVVRCTEMPGTDRTFAAAQALAAKEGRGDVALDGDALVGLRGATLALLPVKNWFDADDWTTDELRGAIKDAGKERLSVKGVPSMNGRHKTDRSQGEIFAVVQTKEGRIAVLYVSGYEFGLGFWCRARAAK